MNTNPTLNHLAISSILEDLPSPDWGVFIQVFEKSNRSFTLNDILSLTVHHEGRPSIKVSDSIISTFVEDQFHWSINFKSRNGTTVVSRDGGVLLKKVEMHGLSYVAETEYESMCPKTTLNGNVKFVYEYTIPEELSFLDFKATKRVAEDEPVRYLDSSLMLVESLPKQGKYRFANFKGEDVTIHRIKGDWLVKDNTGPNNGDPRTCLYNPEGQLLAEHYMNTIVSLAYGDCGRLTERKTHSMVPDIANKEIWYPIWTDENGKLERLEFHVNGDLRLTYTLGQEK